MSGDLLKRLKSDYSGGYCNKRNIKAAIAVIEALQAENARLRQALDGISNHSPMFDYAVINAGKVDLSLPGSPFDRGRAQEAKHLSSIARAALSAPDPAPEAPDMARPGNDIYET